MEDFRSKSYNANGLQIQPTDFQDFRCYSTSHAPSSSYETQKNEVKFKKTSSKSTNGSINWSFSDPELQRKKRVASYKAYTVEGKVKGSIKKSFRWIKDKYSQMVYGLRS